MGGCLPIRVLLGITRVTDDATHGPQLGQSTLRLELRSDGRGQHGPLLLGAVDVYKLTGMQIPGSGEWPRSVMNAQQSAPCLDLARERIRRRMGGLGRGVRGLSDRWNRVVLLVFRRPRGGRSLMSRNPFALAGEAFGGEMGRFGGDITFGAGPLGSAWRAGVFAAEGAAACAGGVAVDAASVISTSCDWPELSAPAAFAGGAVE